PNTIAKVVNDRKHLNEEKQRRRPDVRLSVTDGYGSILMEVGHGEIKSSKYDRNGASAAQDLVWIGLLLKDQLDAVEDLFGIMSCLPLDIQVVGSEASLYLMVRCGNFYIMVKMTSMSIPDSITGLLKVAADFKRWRQVEQVTINGYLPLLAAKKAETSFEAMAKVHFPTIMSLELNLIKTNIALLSLYFSKCVPQWRPRSRSNLHLASSILISVSM
ncbi:hypothetical protein BGZ76_011562, partial [Entomortierella beljakovae]